MPRVSDLERASELLHFCWRSVVFDDCEAGALEDEFAEVQRLYDAAPQDDLAVATGTAVLSFIKLQAHVHEEIQPTGWGEATDTGDSLPVLEEDDDIGRGLAAEAVRTARRALEADPRDNLAALTLGLSLEFAGATEDAIDAYRDVLRTNPGDDDVRLRLGSLDVRPPPDPRDPDTCRHSQGFFLLQMHARTGNSDGDDWYWLFTDHARIRPMVDGFVADHAWEDSFEDGDDDKWDPRSLAFDPSPLEKAYLLVHRPGEPETAVDLYRALRRTPDGTVRIDWPSLDLPGPAADLLSPYRPVRVDDRTFFFGLNSPMWEDAERP